MENQYRRLRIIVTIMIVFNLILAIILCMMAYYFSTGVIGLVTPQPTSTSIAQHTLTIPTPLPSLTPQPTATPTIIPTPTVPITATRFGILHTVRAGETLWSISKYYYNTGYAWFMLLDYNPQYSESGLSPGEQIFIPRPAGGMPNYITTPVPESVPIRASSYTLNRKGYASDEQNPNCNNDCSNLALTSFDPAFYGRVAACPSEWLGTQKTVRLTVSGLGTFYCLDTGTLIKFTCREVSGYGQEPICLYEVDFLCENFPPPFHGQLFYDWSIEWVPLEEAIRASKSGPKACE